MINVLGFFQIQIDRLLECCDVLRLALARPGPQHVCNRAKRENSLIKARFDVPRLRLEQAGAGR